MWHWGCYLSDAFWGTQMRTPVDDEHLNKESPDGFVKRFPKWLVWWITLKENYVKPILYICTCRIANSTAISMHKCSLCSYVFVRSLIDNLSKENIYAVLSLDWPVLGFRFLPLNHHLFWTFTRILLALKLHQRLTWSVCLIATVEYVRENIRNISFGVFFLADSVEIISRGNAIYYQRSRKGKARAGRVGKWWPCIWSFS